MLARSLLLAASGTLEPSVRVEYARRAWTAYASLTGAMASLEERMPRSAEEGYAWQARAKDIQEQSR